MSVSVSECECECECDGGESDTFDAADELGCVWYLTKLK